MSVEDQFEGDERALLKRIQELLDVRMKDKRKRYVHSLGVAETALHLAEVYGVDRFDAAAAGLIHDWDKVLSDDELVTRALHYGIKIAGSPSAATPLLHGPVAAYELPQLFPELSPAVFQAVDRHTVGACDMTPLDMVVFVADAIEPPRRLCPCAAQDGGEVLARRVVLLLFCAGSGLCDPDRALSLSHGYYDLQPLRPAALARAV